MKAFKFQRVAHVQRAVSVCANSTGAFGALRVDYKPPPIIVTGRQFSADMAAIAPYILDEAMVPVRQAVNIPSDEIAGTDDDPEDSLILDDIAKVAKLMAILYNRVNQVGSLVKGSQHGADLTLRIGAEFELPVHRVVLAARCIPLRDLFGGHGVVRDACSKISMTFTPAPAVLYFAGISPFSLLILLHYLYSDEVLAVWDLRIGSHFEPHFPSLGLSAVQVKADLDALARLLSLPHLTAALQSVGKRAAKPSAGDCFRWLFDQAQLSSSSRRDVSQDPLAPDVALHLADMTIYMHSAVLYARSAFFAALFSDPDWTVDRRDAAGVVDVDMRHHKWQVMQFVLPFICFGEEKMFETLGELFREICNIILSNHCAEFVDNTDELLDFMFLVISVAVKPSTCLPLFQGH